MPPDGKQSDAMPAPTLPEESATDPAKASPRLLLITLSLTMLMPSFATSSANAALPALAQAFAASFQMVQWIVLAFLLAITTLVVIVGRLGDMIGRRRLMLAGIVIFTLASLACGSAPSLPMLIAGRVVQGIGAAILMALTIAFVGDGVPREKTGAAMGLLGTMSAVGTTLGPSLGGVLMGWVDWRVIFLVNIPFGTVALLLAWRSLPDERGVAGPGFRGFDHIGMLLLGLTLISYSLAMTIGRGHPGLANAALLAAAGLGTLAFLIVESRVRSPLIRLALLRDRALSRGLATNMLVSTVMMTNLIVGPFYLSRALGLAPVPIGLLLSLGPLIAALTGIPAGRLVDRFGSARTSMAGLLTLASGCGGLALFSTGSSVIFYAIPIAMMAAGYSIFQAANNSVIMADARPDERGLRSGMIGLARNLGFITGASAMGALFAIGTGAPDMLAASPDAVAVGMRLTFVAAAMMAVGCLVIAAPRGRAGMSRL